jgi:hypothetical protein
MPKRPPVIDDLIAPFRGVASERPLTDDACLRQFPGPIERARRLASLYPSLAVAFMELRRDHNVTPDEARALFEALIAEFASGAHEQDVYTEEELLRQLARVPQWRDRRGDVTPPQFVRRHYRHYLGKGLTRAILRKLDERLYHSLAAWVRRHPEDDIPELGKRADRIDQQIARLSVEFSPDELRRLGLALQARERRRKRKQNV